MTLKLHHLRPAPGAKTAKTRVGRGEGSKGKTAGRGTKGSKARNKIPAYFEGGQLPLHMRLPKLKGFKNPFRVEFQVVNLDRIGELFPEGGSHHASTTSSPRARSARASRVKVLGQGDIDGRRPGERPGVLRLGEAEDRGRRRFDHHRLSHARHCHRRRGDPSPARDSAPSTYRPPASGLRSGGLWPAC